MNYIIDSGTYLGFLFDCLFFLKKKSIEKKRPKRNEKKEMIQN
jgi:hypothetical protein